MSDRLNTLQLLFMFMLAIGFTSHVVAIPVLLETAHRDAWLSEVLALLFVPVFLIVPYFFMKQSKQAPLFLWLKTEFGSSIAYFFSILSSGYLLVTSCITMKDTVTFTTTSYLTTTPNIVILLMLVLLCFWDAYCGIHSIAKTSFVILPVVLCLGVFVALATIPQKDYSLLRPFLEDGWRPVFQGILPSLLGGTELVLLLFMQQYVRPNISFRSFLLIGVLCASLAIGPTIGAIIEFGPEEATKLRYPAFEQWRLVTLGTFIEHLDFLSIYQWLSGAFIRISLATTLILELFHVRSQKGRAWMLVAIYLGIVAFSLAPMSDTRFFQWLSLYTSRGALYLFALSLLLSLLALLSKLRKKRLEEKENGM
ncbi:spore germination protein (amino acid permease) [Anoxybacillus voinovskiensis]|uniref:Spore germination protein (Amino acid permease) n=1 Tax=Anoxybacteroides voinovskiense TaxID=230470 RepID=A0A840DXZ1_9BACL|nr:endospore germination permease [Anoxybacillus voinovskiensis]MBB4073896.1 spore germination protein (amino acid permease) [Anoxybacillus voinovskiensis]GGJ66303.1 hypothetical protein GCM10008982_14450 [Anoxybacillus voinovskiensis]